MEIIWEWRLKKKTVRQTDYLTQNSPSVCTSIHAWVPECGFFFITTLTFAQIVRWPVNLTYGFVLTEVLLFTPILRLLMYLTFDHFAKWYPYHKNKRACSHKSKVTNWKHYISPKRSNMYCKCQEVTTEGKMYIRARNAFPFFYALGGRSIVSPKS